MRYLESYGAVWKVSERNYKQFMHDVAADKPWRLDDYGKCIVTGFEAVTDITPEDASDKLEYMRKAGK